MSPEQRDDVETAFRRGFEAAQKRLERDMGDPKLQEEWGSYCSEIAVLNLWLGDTAEAVIHAGKAVGTWQSLWKTAPTNQSYKAQLGQACIALGALQLVNGQPQAAVVSARRGLDLDDNSAACKAILVMGRLLDGQYEQARTLLMENSTLEVAPKQTFPAAVLDDLRRLREKGLIPPNTEQLEQRLAADLGVRIQERNR